MIKTSKQSNDPHFEAKKNRVLELYEIANGKVKPKKSDPSVVICMDEFGPLDLLPRPGKRVGLMIVGGERQRRTTPAAGAGQPTPAPRACVT